MVEYTTYIPKELLFNKVTSLQLLVGIAIIFVFIFLVYKFYESNFARKKPESF